MSFSPLGPRAGTVVAALSLLHAHTTAARVSCTICVSHTEKPPTHALCSEASAASTGDETVPMREETETSRLSLPGERVAEVGVHLGPQRKRAQAGGGCFMLDFLSAPQAVGLRYQFRQFLASVSLSFQLPLVQLGCQLFSVALRHTADRLSQVCFLDSTSIWVRSEPGRQHRLSSEGDGSPFYLFPHGRVQTERIRVLSTGSQG